MNSNGNGDSQTRYRITQPNPEGDALRRWVVKLGSPDLDGSKLKRWVRQNGITGDLQVTVEQRVGDQWFSAGPFPIDADTLQ